MLTGYHFNFFTKYFEPVKWMWYKKYVKHVPLNHKIAKSFEVFLLALFAVNSSLNQIFPKLWLYFRQTWKTQLGWTISLWGFVLFNLKGIFCSLACSNSVRWVFFGKSKDSCLYFWLNVFHLVSYFLYQSLTSFLSLRQIEIRQTNFVCKFWLFSVQNISMEWKNALKYQNTLWMLG